MQELNPEELTGTDAEADQLEAGESLEAIPVWPNERYDLRILRSMRRIIRSVDIHSRRLAHEYGVTVPQLLCMLKIDEVGPMTLKELSMEVYLNPSTLVGIVDRLEKQEVFRRERSVKDRRKVRISLTESGREMLARAPSPLQESLLEGISRLPELERATIALSLEKILELLDQPSEEGKPALYDESAPILESGMLDKSADTRNSPPH